MSRPINYCKFEGCDNRCSCQGYCAKHWANIKRHGFPEPTRAWGEDKKNHPLYQTYCGIKRRCSGKHTLGYYQINNITLCDRWSGRDGFWNFVKDMGDRPTDEKFKSGKSIWSVERIDNSKGYSPDNCKWAKWSEQNANHGFRYCPCCGCDLQKAYKEGEYANVAVKNLLAGTPTNA